MIGRHLRRRLTCLYPSIKRIHNVELIRSITAGAVKHARDHEEPHELLLFWSRPKNLVIVMDRVEGANQPITPSVP